MRPREHLGGCCRVALALPCFMTLLRSLKPKKLPSQMGEMGARKGGTVKEERKTEANPLEQFIHAGMVSEMVSERKEKIVVRGCLCWRNKSCSLGGLAENTEVQMPLHGTGRIQVNRG